MLLSSSHSRGAIAWDITVNVKATSGEFIREPRVRINGEPMISKSLQTSSCTTWIRTYPQRGDYPVTTHLEGDGPHTGKRLVSKPITCRR